MYWMMNPFHNHHSFIPVINAWAYDMIRIHGVKKALTHISVKLREHMQYLNGGVYIIHVWKFLRLLKIISKYEIYAPTIEVPQEEFGMINKRWKPVLLYGIFIIISVYEHFTPYFNFYRFLFSSMIFVRNELKRSDLFHHKYPSKWANCSKNHQQQQATKIYLLLVHIIARMDYTQMPRYALHYRCSLSLFDIYLYFSSNQKLLHKMGDKNKSFFSFLWLRLAVASLNEYKMTHVSNM